jgi:sec-independent protein translocase protein TatA
MPNLGIWEILLILLVVLIVFGPKRLPEMGRSLGRGMREFKDSISNAAPRTEDLEGEATPAQPAVTAATGPETETPTPTATSGTGATS